MKRLNAAYESMRIRLVTAMSVVATASVCALLAACASTPTEAFSGTEFNNVEPAFDFQLQNQFGDVSSLADHKDKVVVLTFLYTNCPDVCPIITTQLRETFRDLTDVEDQVEFIAVSVDPERDTVSEAHDFLGKWGLLNDWSYLVGTEGQLEPIWKAYFVDPGVDDRNQLQTSNPASLPAQTTGALDSLSQRQRSLATSRATGLRSLPSTRCPRNIPSSSTVPPPMNGSITTGCDLDEIERSRVRGRLGWKRPG